MSRKLTLVFVDSLRTDTLLQAAADGDAPAFASLLERGTPRSRLRLLVPDGDPGLHRRDHDRRGPRAAAAASPGAATGSAA